MYFTFLGEGTTVLQPDLLPEVNRLRIIHMTETEICAAILPSGGASTPDFMSILSRVAGNNLTTRNWNTVGKIAKLD